MALEYGIVTTSGLTTYDSNSWEMGWSFTVKGAAITVTGLRCLLPNVQTQTANLWSSSGTLLGSVSLTSVAGQWVVGKLATPVVLQPNTTYIVSMYAYLGRYNASSSGFTYNSKLSYVTAKYGSTKNACPGGSESGNQYPLVDIVMGEDVTYPSSGTYITEPIDLSLLPNKLRLQAVTTTPANTAITFHTAVSDNPTHWVLQTAGELISNIPAGDLTGKSLQIKATLSTTDSSVTPSLSSLSIEKEAPESTRLLITLTNKLKYPQGEVSVAYNPGNGNLTGEQGSSILEFTQSLTPTGIPPFFNPNNLERVEVASVAVTSNLMGIAYKDGYATENVQVSSVSVTAALTDVANLP